MAILSPRGPSQPFTDRGLIWAFATAHQEADASVRVVILKGAGRTFSAGYDLTPAQRTGADGVVRSHRGATADGKRLLMGTRTGMQNITDIHMYFWNMDKVTIAQVHGYALAGGCELCMMADLVVAAEDAQMGHPGLRGLGTSRTGLIWPLVIGMRKCKELMYTGENISGLEAEECGMVNYAWPIDELDARTIAVSAAAPFGPAGGNSRSVVCSSRTASPCSPPTTSPSSRSTPTASTRTWASTAPCARAPILAPRASSQSPATSECSNGRLRL